MSSTLTINNTLNSTTKTKTITKTKTKTITKKGKKANKNTLNNIDDIQIINEDLSHINKYNETNTANTDNSYKDSKIDFSELRKTLFGPKYKVIGRTNPKLSQSDDIVKNILKLYEKTNRLKSNKFSSQQYDELFNKICSEPIHEEEEYDPNEGLLNGLGKYFSISSGPNNELITDKKQISDIMISVYDSISSEFLNLHKQINDLEKNEENNIIRDNLTKRFASITQVLANLIKFRLS